jgi:predicted Zn-ribbon and HTH transcriptional regulator
MHDSVTNGVFSENMREKTVSAGRCPHCGRLIKDYRPTADSDMERSCRKCGYKWSPRRGEPLRCPSCGSYRWAEDSVRCTCIKCGHEWFSRSDRPPERCPKCKTRAWRQAKFPEKKPERRTVSERKTGPAALDEVCRMYQKEMGCMKISEITGHPLLSILVSIRENLGVRKPRL